MVWDFFSIESSTALTDKLQGEGKYISWGEDKTFADCLITLEQTENALTISSEFCGRYIVDDIVYNIVDGSQLFVNGLHVGNLIESGFKNDFTDYGQGYKNQLINDVSITSEGELIWYKSLNSERFTDYVIEKLK